MRVATTTHPHRHRPRGVSLRRRSCLCRPPCSPRSRSRAAPSSSRPTREPANLNPAIAASNGVLLLREQGRRAARGDGLRDGGLRPLLAESWEGSEDGLTFTVHLREGVTWRDGEPFTSADVAFSAMEVWKPFGNLGRVLFANLESVDTPDDHTAIFHFSQPMPVAADGERDAGGRRRSSPSTSSRAPSSRQPRRAPNPYNLAPSGTGPFVLTEYQPGVLYRLDGQPRPTGTKASRTSTRSSSSSCPTPATKANALETGDVQLTAFSAIPLHRPRARRRSRQRLGDHRGLRGPDVRDHARLQPPQRDPCEPGRPQGDPDGRRPADHRRHDLPRLRRATRRPGRSRRPTPPSTPRT